MTTTTLQTIDQQIEALRARFMRDTIFSVDDARLFLNIDYSAAKQLLEAGLAEKKFGKLSRLRYTVPVSL